MAHHAPLLKTALALSIASMALGAQAAVTFEQGSFTDSVYAEAGFQVSGGGGTYAIPNATGSGWASSGRLSAADGSLFDFSQVDVLSMYVGAASYDFISFTGTHADGTTNTSWFVITPPGAQVTPGREIQVNPDSNGVTTINFGDGFSNLSQLTWSSGAHYVDNIGVSASSGPAVSPVPEPETYALMLAGLGFVGWTARRRTRQAAMPALAL